MKRKVVPPGQGEAPKVRPGAGDPPPKHRCAECRRIRGDCVRAFQGRETDRWLCQDCLATQGQDALPL